MRGEAVIGMLGTVDIYPHPPHEYLGWWVSNVVGLTESHRSDPWIGISTQHSAWLDGFKLEDSEG
jgi:hypothetical protein